jgi:hypothetical protein
MTRPPHTAAEAVPGRPTALIEALAAAEAALRRADADGAAAAVARGAAACAAMAADGEHLAPAQLQALAAAHARCLALASEERDRLAGAVSRAARSRRASDAYGGR